MKRSISTKIIALASRQIAGSKFPPVSITKRNYLHPHIFKNNYVEYKVPVTRYSDKFAGHKL